MKEKTGRMRKMQFFNLDDAISVQKENGTDVSYYIFEEYEIHLNKILAEISTGVALTFKDRGNTVGSQRGTDQ